MSDEKLMPSGWCDVQLEDLVLNPKSDLVDGPFGSNLKSSEYVESGIPVLKIQNIKANRFVRKRLSCVTPKKADELSRHSFVAGDLMITKLGEPLGLCCEVPADLEHGVFVADLMRLRPSPMIVESAFLLHAINSVVVQSQFKEITKGTTRQRVNLSIVRGIKLALPPLAEQRRIVGKIEALFSELDAGVANLKRARAQLAVYRQALLKHAFEGHLTAQWRTQNAPNLESADKLLARIRADREARYQQQLAEWQSAINTWEKNGKSGKRPTKPRTPEDPDKPSSEHVARLWSIPPSWQWVQIGTFAFVTKLAGFEYTDYVHYSEDGDLRVIKAENAGPNGYRVTNYSRIHFDSIAHLKRSLLVGGELLVVFVGAGTGNVATVPLGTSFFLGPNIAMARAESNAVSTRYLELFLRSPSGRDMILAASKAVAQPSLSMETIRQAPIAMPPTLEQHEIVRQLDEQLDAIVALEADIDLNLQKAEALRQSILKKAFAGELVPQDPADEPAAALLARIRAKREAAVVKPKAKQAGKRPPKQT